MVVMRESITDLVFIRTFTVEHSYFISKMTFYFPVPDPVTRLECQAIDEPSGLLLVTWEAPSEVNGVIKGYVINYTLIDRGHCGHIGDSEDTGVRQVLSDDTEVSTKISVSQEQSIIHSKNVYA